MAVAGDSKFTKILKEHGGYLTDKKYIKYITHSPIDNCEFMIRPNEIQMEFGVIDDKLVTRLHIQMYEPVDNKCFVANNVKFINFNLKCYKLTDARLVKGHKDKSGRRYTQCYLLLDEV